MMKPISLSEFRGFLNACALIPSSKIGIAVSGSPQTMALLALMKEAMGPDELMALTFDPRSDKGISSQINQLKIAVNSMGMIS